MKRPLGVLHDRRELGVRQGAGTDRLDEVRQGQQCPTDPLLRVQDTDLLLETVADDRDRFLQVAVVADDHSHIEGVVEGIDQQMGGNVDVRSLFLGLDHAARGEAAGPPIGGIGHVDIVRQEMAEMDADLRHRPKRPEIGLLTRRRVGIVRRTADLGSESADGEDIVLGQHRAAECVNIQPLVRSFPQAAIVEVVTVDRDDRPHPHLEKSSGGHKDRRAPRPRSAEGDVTTKLDLSSHTSRLLVRKTQWSARKVDVT